MQKGVIKREVEIVSCVTRKSVLDKGGGFKVSRPGVIKIRKKNENRKKKNSVRTLPLPQERGHRTNSRFANVLPIALGQFMQKKNAHLLVLQCDL